MSEVKTSANTSDAVDSGSVGIVVPQDFTSDQPFTFKSGQTIPGFNIRYETYGELN